MSLYRLIRSATEKNSILNGKAIHARVIISGPDPDPQTCNHLLTMYSKLGDIEYAQKLFDRMPVRNLVTWASLISAYSQIRLSDKALDCFRSMVLDSGITPNDYTYVAAISACAQLRALRIGKEVHARMIRMEESFNAFVNNSLVNFYGKCGLLKSARIVFDTIPEVNVVSCVSLIVSYTQCGEHEGALRVFLRSLKMGVKVNEFMYGSLLGACAALEILEAGQQVQSLALKSGVRMDHFVVTCLVNFYAKCGELDLASKALREAEKTNVTAWTALIGGFMHKGMSKEAIDVFREMLSGGLRPNEQTFASLLGAFSWDEGIPVHCLITKMGFQSFTFVSNSLLDFYAKSNSLNDSLKIFSEMDVHDTVSWNALIAGCISSARYELAIEFIQDMLFDGFTPDIYTYSSLLNICGDLPATEWGKQTHCCIMKPGLYSNVVVGSALVDMYAKCGRLNDARKAFDSLPRKNLVSWNAMIGGYAQHGFGTEALQIYDSMLRNGVKPNDVTFLAVLSSCGHVGALEESLHHFASMSKDFGVTPRVDHLACVVSLYARKGETKAAYDLVKNFPCEPNKVVWRGVLSGCVMNKDLELATLAAEQILSIDPNDTSARVMLSNLYAGLNMWDEASKVRELMEGKMVKKETGCSWT